MQGFLPQAISRYEMLNRQYSYLALKNPRVNVGADIYGKEFLSAGFLPVLNY